MNIPLFRLLRVLAVLFFITVFPAGNSLAVQIELSNGDRVSGEIIEETEHHVTLKTEMLGEITIERRHMAAGPDGHEQPGRPANTDNENKNKVIWDNSLETGFSQSGGNTESASGMGKIRLNRKRLGDPQDEWTLEAEGHYGASGRKMNEQRFRGMLRYAYSFGQAEKWYHFYRLDGEKDRFANIDYRLVPATGAGYWFSDQEDFKLLAEAGLGYQHTRYRGDLDDEGEAVLAARGYWEKLLTGNLRLIEDLKLYPSLEDLAEYRLYSETRLTHPVSDRLSWNLSFIEEFNSAPKGGAKKNDYRIVSSMIYSF